VRRLIQKGSERGSFFWNFIRRGKRPKEGTKHEEGQSYTGGVSRRGRGGISMELEKVRAYTVGVGERVPSSRSRTPVQQKRRKNKNDF